MILKVYHLTVLGNLKSINEHGIIPRAQIEKVGKFIDIADPEVESNHRKILVSDGKIERPVDEYARCFFNPLPPMYYVREKTHNDLCVLEVHIPVTVVEKYGKIFHNPKINGARFPIILKEGITWNRNHDIKNIVVHNLDYIKWDCSKEALNRNYNDTLAKRSAEMLVYPRIPASYIKAAYSKHPKHRSLDELRPISASGHAQIDH